MKARETAWYQETMNESKGGSMVSGNSASGVPAFVGFVDALTINPGCPVRKREIHTKRATEKGTFTCCFSNSTTETQYLKKEEQNLYET